MSLSVEPGFVSSKSITRMTIDDAGHMSPEKRQQIINSYKPHEREARALGKPVLGSGRIFPVTHESISVDPFALPDHWYRIAGIDFGWDHPTAAVDCAIDRDSGVFYVTKEYARSEAVPLLHCAAVKPWGGMPWAWPKDGLQTEKSTGVDLETDYREHGMRMLNGHAVHPSGGVSVEAGLQQMLNAMLMGKFKVFSHLTLWFEEFDRYHRNEGKVVKKYDDLLDATRYAWMMQRFADAPQLYENQVEDHQALSTIDQQRDIDTGY